VAFAFDNSQSAAALHHDLLAGERQSRSKDLRCRAIADHETLIALHELSKRQLDILNAQNQILDVLKKHADGPT
jgi:hypothetical protein